MKTVESKSQESAAQALGRELDELRRQIAALEMAEKHRPEYGLERGDPPSHAGSWTARSLGGSDSVQQRSSRR